MSSGATPSDPSPASGRTRTFGVIGDPIEHSLSPALHEMMLAHWGIEARYLPFRVEPGRLDATLDRIRARDFSGINITLPHKISAATLVDRLEGDAAVLGAVNTVRLEEDGTLSGHNTDVRGLELALRYAGDDALLTRGRGAPGPALVLGAGGAARAAVLALARAGFDPIAVSARRPARALDLIDRLRSALPRSTSTESMELSSLALSALQTRIPPVALVAQATSCGIGDQADLSPWPSDLPYPEDAALLDLVYQPEATPFLRRAGRRPSSDGLPMLVWQGALALAIFAGTPLPPPDQVREWERALRERQRKEGT